MDPIYTPTKSINRSPFYDADLPPTPTDKPDSHTQYVLGYDNNVSTTALTTVSSRNMV